MWRQTSGWVTCAKLSKRNTDPGVFHTFSRRFSKQNYTKYISDVVSKILEKKATIIRCFVWICDLPEIGCPVVKDEIFIANFFHVSPNRFWRIFSMLLNSHPTIKRRWKKFYRISLMLNHNLTGLYDWLIIWHQNIINQFTVAHPETFPRPIILVKYYSVI